MASVPRYKSAYGKVDMAFVGSNDMMPVGLGPCSQCIDIQQRHQEGDRCWGTFQSNWFLQGDTSLKCAQNAYHLQQFDGYYTGPQSDTVYVQDVQDDGASVAAAQSGIDSSLRAPVTPASSGVNVPSTGGVGYSGQQTSTQQSEGYVATGVQYPSSQQRGLSYFSRPFF